MRALSAIAGFAMAAGAGILRAPYVRGSGSSEKRREMNGTRRLARLAGEDAARRGASVEAIGTLDSAANHTAYIQGHRSVTEPRLPPHKHRKPRVR